jgi:hypothetical protein
MDIHDLDFLGQLLFIALGVAASVLIPVLMAAAPKGPSGRGFGARLWTHLRPYLALAVASLLIALVVLAILESQDQHIKEWWQALLAGYVSDSTLQKFKQG